MAAVKQENKKHEDKKHEDADAAAAPRKTIFVRNLPFDTTSKQLEESFSDFGPIKQAFVVKDRDNASKCRGFGYVHFVLQDDANTAVKATKLINDRKVKLCYANKKPKHEKRKQQQQQDKDTEEKNEDESEVIGSKVQNQDDIHINKEEEASQEELSKKMTEKASQDHSSKLEEKNKEDSMEPINKKKKPNVNSDDVANTEKTDLQRTLVLTGLTSKVKRKAFRILCEKFGTIEKIVYPVPERSEVTAFVRYSDFKSVIRAVQKIPGQKVKKSNILSAVLLTKEGKFPSKKVLGLSRLIVRNLDFKCEENDLREIFSKFGNIVDINIPTKTVKNRTVKIGCAFIQFESQIHAKAAIESMNLKEIKGRAVVIDWAVSKEKYEEKKTEVMKEKKIKNVKKEKNEELNVSKDIKVEESGNVKKEKKIKNVTKKKNEESDVLKDIKVEESDNESEAESIINEDDEDECSVEDSEEGEEMEDDCEDGEDDDDDEATDGDDEGTDEVDELDSENEEEAKQRKKQQMKDAKEGKTIFIRNLSYNIEDEDLSEEFEKYGEVDYCKIVYDHETGRSKGSAFIKFQGKDSADKCIQEIEKLEREGKPLSIEGRTLAVSLAVTRGKVNEIVRQKADSKKETDKRNLYLACEGMIAKNSPAHETLSEGDQKKRDKAMAEKKVKLKNPNYFVSRTRLCVRNLPLTTDANELRTIFQKHSPGPIKLREIKIMRSKERKDAKGVPRSLGFGFVNVDTHENALALLRATNNNPDIFGDKRRPFVEFSVENAKALKLLEQRKSKNEQKLLQFKENNVENTKQSEEENTKDVRDKRRHDWWNKRVVRYQKRRVQKRDAREGSDIQDKTTKTSKETEGNPISTPLLKRTAKENSIETDTKDLKRKSVEIDENRDVKRTRKIRHGNNEKEEDKFNKLVTQYKDKLFPKNTTKQKKSERWFT